MECGSHRRRVGETSEEKQVLESLAYIDLEGCACFDRTRWSRTRTRLSYLDACNILVIIQQRSFRDCFSGTQDY